ncbi:MAG: ATP-dependent sacrificial sulfur transferase LarE [Dehalococcoidia bacterium]|nr:ATP-dependent sacrificial sulfur transferase LarE [Dehalococcoidia bacterium]
MKSRKLNEHSKIGDKVGHLGNIIGRLGSAIVAYSGGVDSTFLSVTAADILKDRVMIVLAKSPLMEVEEFNAAKKLASGLKLKLTVIEFNQLDIPDFTVNNKDRCYHCKLNMLGILNETARARHIRYVCDGTNYDDLSEFRPGLVAIAELGVRSPLAESFLTKQEIRSLARKKGLPNWKKPAMPCLATRIPHRTPITHEVIGQVSSGESFIKGLGIEHVRLRHHRNIARIEVDQKGFTKLLKKDNRKATVEALKELGYKHITVDLAGYQMGSMSR